MSESILQEARELAEELEDGDNDYGEERRILLGLCDLVAEWKAVAVQLKFEDLEEERYVTNSSCNSLEYDNRTDSDLKNEALTVLGTELSNWKKIDQAEKDALTLAIGTMKSEAELLDQMERMNLGETRANINSLLDAIEVLKRLKE